MASIMYSLREHYSNRSVARFGISSSTRCLHIITAPTVYYIVRFGLMIYSADGTDDMQYFVLMICTHPRDDKDFPSKSLFLLHFSRLISVTNENAQKMQQKCKFDKKEVPRLSQDTFLV
ncbi:MAG: hypothetical protein J6Y74_03725 [Clostridia bacterium]|nr:hypothetical protein [Clostridia bacterium]